jgi:hypothetical protein
MAGQPYVVITADSHAGASVETYRDYSTKEHQKPSTSGAAGTANPHAEAHRSKKHKNWDDAERGRDMEAEGIAGEIIFPNTVPPFFRTSV